MHTQSRSPSRERDHRISLMPMARPEGEPGLLLGVLILAAGLLIIFAAALLISAAMHQPPARSLADHTPSDAPVPSAAVEAGGQRGDS